MDLPGDRTLAAVCQLLDPMPSLFIGLDAGRRIALWNARAEEITGRQAADVVGHLLEECAVAWATDRIMAGLEACRQSAEPVRIDGLACDRTGGAPVVLGLTLIPLAAGAVHGLGIMIIGNDISTRCLLEDQLAQSQKMEAIGHLAAGIAHEISTPAQFVGDNTHFLSEAFDDLRQIMARYQVLASSIRREEDPAEPLLTVDAVVSELDLDYLVAEIPLAIDHILDGVGRISKIVRSMKFFAHPGDGQKKPLDINEAIESTVIISRNEWKYVAVLETDLDPALPPVPGRRGEINQVLLNLITNAAHAIADKIGNSPEDKGHIRIGTRVREGWAEIRIQDTGGGIPEAMRHQVFDLFFTTKEEGHGSGQGLAIAHTVIVDNHGGHLTFESVPGEGTTFMIRLPLHGEVPAYG